MNNSFDNMTIFRSFVEATEGLTPEQFKEAWLAVFHYGLDGTEEDLSPVSKMFFTMAKPVIDKSREKKKNARTGGQTEASEKQTEANVKQTASKSEANEKQIESKREANGKQTGSKQEANDNRIKEIGNRIKDKGDKELGVKDLGDRSKETGEGLKENPPCSPHEGTNEPYGSCAVQEIIDDLNEVCGTHYRTGKATTQMINARLKEKFTVEDFKTVHRKKAAEWLGTEQEQFLRPETLYTPKHFESYLNQPDRRVFKSRDKPKFDADEYLMKIAMGAQ